MQNRNSYWYHFSSSFAELRNYLTKIQFINPSKFETINQQIVVDDDQENSRSREEYNSLARKGVYRSIEILPDVNNLPRTVNEIRDFCNNILRILHIYKEKLPPGLYLNFFGINLSEADGSIRDIIKQFARNFKNGAFPKDTTIDFSGTGFFDFYLIPFLNELLATSDGSKEVEGMRLKLGTNPIGFDGIKMLCQFLNSKAVPYNFNLELSEINLDLKSWQELSKALSSGNCKEGLSIQLDDYGFLEEIGLAKIEALCGIFESGNLPSNFSLSLARCVFGQEQFTRLMKSIENGKLPSNFSLSFASCTFSETQFSQLMTALTWAKLPRGFRLDLNLITVIPDQQEYVEKEICKLLKCGNLPDGFRLNLTLSREFTQIEALIDALSTDNCPNNLSLWIKLLPEDAKSLLIAIANNTKLVDLSLRTTKLRADLHENALNNLIKSNLSLQYLRILTGADLRVLSNELEIFLERRNQLIDKYPEYKDLILKLCRDEGMYNQESSPPSLKNLSALVAISIVGPLAQGVNINNNNTKDLNLPNELIEFIQEITALRNKFIRPSSPGS